MQKLWQAIYMERTNKESFIGLTGKWDNFLHEKNKDKKTGKSYYIHKRLEYHQRFI
jgi:hypothetical protein